jgi:hypothetical protein
MRCKSILSVFIICAFPTVSFASVLTNDDSDGLEDTAVLGSTDLRGFTGITNAQELSDIRNNLSGRYYLANDITFSAGSGSNFTPIGRTVDLRSEAYSTVTDM